MTRGLKALAAVARGRGAGGARVPGAHRGGRRRAAGGAPSSERAPARTTAAGGRARRGHVRAQPRHRRRDVEVQTWLRAAATRSPSCGMTTTDPDLLPGSVESLDLACRTTSTARLLAHRDSVGTNPQRIRLRESATDLYFSYTIDGGMDDASATVQGRTLARVLGMDVDYDGAGGVVRRVVTATGTVLNVACLRPTQDFDESAETLRQAHRRRRLGRRPPRRPPARPAPGPAGGLTPAARASLSSRVAPARPVTSCHCHDWITVPMAPRCSTGLASPQIRNCRGSPCLVTPPRRPTNASRRPCRPDATVPATREGRQNAQLDTLREQVRGTVTGPDDEGYDVARAVRNGMIDKRPAVVVQPVNAGDVMTAVASPPTTR